MRVTVDRDICFGYGRCSDLVPEVFSLDEDGKSVAGDASGVEPRRLGMAAWTCPMQAITVLTDDGEEVAPNSTTDSMQCE